MLNEFFKFASSHRNTLWIHWNIRDINFGFDALEKRYLALTNKKKVPFSVKDFKKIDLARIMNNMYSKYYVKKGYDKIGRLLKINNYSHPDLLTGTKEAELTDKGYHMQVQRSTLKKLHAFDFFISEIDKKTLKVDASFFQRKGIGWPALKSIGKSFLLLYGFLKLILKIKGR